MEMKYYDLLSTTIIGVVVVAVVNYLFLGNNNIDGVVYISLGYLVGYFINAIGSLCEEFYYCTIGGKPSDKLLVEVNNQNWTGYNRVRFYEIKKATELLKNELGDQNASTSKMFSCAMRKVNSCKESRVPAFNAQYAWSRNILTSVWIVELLIGFRYYDNLLFWLISLLLLLISWNRFKERGYYYAREVLNEYMKQTSAVSNNNAIELK